MNPVRVALVVALLVVASSIAAGAAAPAQTADADEAELPMGARLSSVMQANAGQARGVVENGMWEASFADADGEQTQRVLVDRRAVALNGSMAELAAERRTLREELRNGDITHEEYQIQLAGVVGQLAAVGDGIDETGERARALGVDTTRLERLRSQASELGGDEVSEIARNLSGNGDPPGRSGVFGDGGPGKSGERGQGQGSSDDNRRGPPTETPTATEDDGDTDT